MRISPSSKIKRNSGYTIIELMVAVAIGLAIVVAIGELFVANKLSYRLQDDSSRLQESAGAAFDLLGYHIRQAGYVDISDAPGRLDMLLNKDNKAWLKKTDPNIRKDVVKQIFGDPGGVYTGAIQGVMGCDSGFSSTTSVTPPWTCGGSGPSAIIVAYQALPTARDNPLMVESSIRPSFDALAGYDATTGAGGDCGARDVNGSTANPKGPLAINMFYVDTATKRLMCTGNGDPSKARPVAEGVEDMVLLYGISPTTGGDAFVGQYVSAANVTDWTRVLSVRVCIQVVSNNPVASTVTSFTDCSGNSQPQSDRKLRRVFRATFSVRNNVLSLP